MITINWIGREIIKTTDVDNHHHIYIHNTLHVYVDHIYFHYQIGSENKTRQMDERG